ncbi:alcohol dehydrogenase catalytic domain-containing protein [Streptomyces sp. NPDC058308]|uniref:alcohol dehydrogenase catalytic domain-containing protein n=1 Tax=Streptomyces sp. NPDC058308 TaxID=3346440 RepID=UPI0036E40F50
MARTGEDTFHWERAVFDDPGPGEVLVRLVAVGLCHTDLSVLTGRLPTPLPAILGHEGAGTVEAVGADVVGIGPGDHVVLSFNSCDHCNACRTGRPTTCETYFPLNFRAARADGTTSIDTEDGAPLGGLFFGQSSLARYAVVSAQSVVRVDVADEEELSLLAPVGCGIRTGAGAILNLLKPHYGDGVAVLGAGAVGLSAVMAARLTPARTIVAVDVVPSRLALATESAPPTPSTAARKISGLVSPTRPVPAV